MTTKGGFAACQWTGPVFLLCSVIYYLTRSPALDEWDSVNFALGVGDFDLWRHQPHPPGYPVYIALGWLFSHGLPLKVPDALALESALGGGLFVAGWFLLLARRFVWPVAAVTAATLATLLITWMTASKALTDALEAGLLALTLVLLDDVTSPTSRRTQWRLTLAGLIAALAAGVRPQNTGIILLILGVAAWRTSQLSLRARLSGLGAFLAACLLWLLPTIWLQAHTPESAGDYLAYPRQLLSQWRWRLDQPKAFLGASGQTGGLIGYRVEHHFLGWLTHGCGFALNSPWGWLAIVLTVLGLAFGVRKQAAGDFWRRHWLWALAYIGMIFCFLPGDQRYYLPIFPLLILPVVAGWWSLLGRRGCLIWVIPLVTLSITLPYAVENHVEPAPPVRLLRWLQAAWPPSERPTVWLILRDSQRHAVWYAPDFHLVRAEDNAPRPLNPAALPGVRAVYTDDPALAAQPASGGRWVLLETFSRSPLIYRKHNQASLYVFRPQSLVE